MLTLRPYQISLVDDIRQALRKNRRVLAVMPPGAGKTTCFADIAHRAAANQKRVLILAHRRELVWQAQARLGTSSHAIEVHSIQSVLRAYKGTPDLVIIDEAHHTAARSWRVVAEKWPVPIVGFTATPQRLDGKGLSDVFDAMVIGPTVADLTAGGFLSRYRLFCPPGRADLGGIKKRAGDYARDQLAERVDQRRIMAAAVRNWKLYGGGRSTIGFCVSLAHADHVRDLFIEAGISAATVDGGMSNTKRDEVLEDFRACRIRVLLSVDLISEGFDVPACDCVLLMRPTASLGLYLQQVGRALRPSDQDAVILDCCGNAEVHGLPDDIREWSLQGIAKERKGQVESIPIRVCPSCYGVHRPRPVCPYCGHVHAVERQIPVEEDVTLIERTQEIRRKRQEVGAARTLEALQNIARQRGYKPGWCEQVMKSRMLKRVTA
jgi:DNA repair protein RadD